MLCHKPWVWGFVRQASSSGFFPDAHPELPFIWCRSFVVISASIRLCNAWSHGLQTCIWSYGLQILDSIDLPGSDYIDWHRFDPDWEYRLLNYLNYLTKKTVKWEMRSVRLYRVSISANCERGYLYSDSIVSGKTRLPHHSLEQRPSSASLLAAVVGLF